MINTLQTAGVPSRVIHTFEYDIEPEFSDIAYDVLVRGKKQVRLIPARKQEKVMSSILKGTLKNGTVITLSDNAHGVHARNLAASILAHLPDLKAQWVNLVGFHDRDDYVETVRDILVIDRLYSKHTSVYRVETARDLAVNSECFFVILIDSEGEPMAFADELGIPVDHALLIKETTITEETI
jgi:hypothetical protein